MIQLNYNIRILYLEIGPFFSIIFSPDSHYSPYLKSKNSYHKPCPDPSTMNTSQIIMTLEIKNKIALVQCLRLRNYRVETMNMSTKVVGVVAHAHTHLTHPPPCHTHSDTWWKLVRKAAFSPAIRLFMPHWSTGILFLVLTPNSSFLLPDILRGKWWWLN